MSQTVYINGSLGDSLSLNNRSIHYGDGLFETILIKNGKPTLFQQHLKRLVNDAKKLSFKDVEIGDLEELINQVSKNYSNVILKLIVSRNQNGRGYAIGENASFDTIITVNEVPKKKSTLKAKVCDIKLAVQPKLAKIKHLNRLEQVMAASELEQGVDEGVLFLQGKDQLIESISNNIFIIKNDQVSTPLLDDAGVEGVAKHQIIKDAPKLNINIIENHISKQELFEADSVFLSNSVFGLREIEQIDGQDFATSHPLFLTLQNQTKSYFIE